MNLAPVENKFGLSERSANTLLEIFKKYPEVIEVWIFGSRAKGNYKTGSDIDLAIMKGKVSQKIIANILSECEESSLPNRVDLIDFHALKTKEFIEHISRVGKVFYKTK